MTAENQDLVINAGDRVAIQDTVTEDGSARDITNHGAQVTLAEFRGGETVVQYDETDSRFTFTDPANGELQAVFTSSDTVDLVDNATDDFYYEIELTDTNNYDYTVTTGEITVKPSY